VRVALVTPEVQTYLGATSGVNAPLGTALLASSRRKAVEGAARDAFRARSVELETELLGRTERAARDGARFVVWSEGALMVAADAETEFLKRAGDAASRLGLHLGVSYLTLPLDGRGRIENVTTLLGPSGPPLWRYLKAHPVPGMERCVAGDGRLPSASTPAGRVTTAICFDLDFPAFLRQAAGADLLLVPSDDWSEIARVHAAMAAFRAVELGVPIARSTSAGISHAVDAYGRELASLDFDAGGERTLLATLPAGSVRTLYGSVGDVVPALAALLGAGLGMAAFRRGPVSRSAPRPAP
jgi:apolipoprotein N-acyltransferase